MWVGGEDDAGQTVSGWTRAMHVDRSHYSRVGKSGPCLHSSSRLPQLAHTPAAWQELERLIEQPTAPAESEGMLSRIQATASRAIEAGAPVPTPATCTQHSPTTPACYTHPPTHHSPFYTRAPARPANKPVHFTHSW